MNPTADFVVYAQDDSIQLVAEVKSTRNGSAAWAAELRRNLFVHATLPSAHFFLLALPHQFFLWINNGAADAALPDYTIDSAIILTPFLGDQLPALDELSETGLELVVGAWLDAVTAGPLPSDLSVLAQAWLLDSGLYAAISNGTLVSQTLA